MHLKSSRLSPVLAGIVLTITALFVLIPSVFAASAGEINASVEDALGTFSKEVPGGMKVLSDAKGYLVLPKVYKAGFGVGGEYGEGALRVGGKTVDYYNIISGSWGFQLGAQRKTVILAFMTEEALQNFRNSSGWKAGVDASVALVKIGAGGSLDTETLKNPVVGFVVGQKGLMYNLSLEGSKFNKIKK